MVKLAFTNIGMVEKAEIELNGLVCIAGENDTGKSTVGKLLFSIVYALNHFEEMFEQDRTHYLLNQAELFYFRLRRLIRLSDEDRLFFGVEFQHELSHWLNSEENVTEKLTATIEKRLLKLEHLHLDEEGKNLLADMLTETIDFLNVARDEEKIKQEAVEMVMRSEFQKSISRLNNENAESLVSITENHQEILRLALKNNRLTEFKLGDPLYYKDVIYIESPFVFYFIDLLQRFMARRLMQRTNRDQSIPYHLKDLFEKLKSKNPQMFSMSEHIAKDASENSLYHSQLESLMGGKMYYKEMEDEFVFQRSGGQEEKFALMNTATGIKALGIFQLLLQSGWLTKRTLLIIDEPEVHLHPSWQIEYARILVELAKSEGVHILVNSHSPYFIEALKVYSDQKGLEEDMKFYHAQKISTSSSVIRDVTNQLEEVFQLLTEPFHQLEEETLQDDEDR
uniref:Endonuclease GajA/Old nuclease/RecF-like AAA domain-containing protein n=1 Tax=Geobacillus sp. (strain WCH70) TaxID=471223 RepID=C5D929_GEOSW